MLEKILFVDDEEHVLSALKRQFRKVYEVSTALGGLAGLEMLASNGPYAVIVADMQMPEMNGIQFLQQAMALSVDSVRLMLTGNADQKTAMSAVNQGCVFRFLTKPCPQETLSAALDAALGQYRLITAERELLEGTMNGSVKLLTDILSMVAPESFGRAVALREAAQQVAGAIQLEQGWNLEMAAMLADLASVAVPPEIQAKIHAGISLSSVEQQVIERLPETGRNLLVNIPRLERVGEIVYYRQKHFDGSGFPEDRITGEAIPVESRILKILSDLLEREAGGTTRSQALQQMTRVHGTYDPLLLRTVSDVLDSGTARKSAAPAIEVSVLGLQPGQILISNIETIDGKLLYSAGNRITSAIVQRLYNYQHVMKIREPIRVCFMQDDGVIAAGRSGTVT
jgi:response regulator RpfG family c-di-GMP phosphodiesterase